MVLKDARRGHGTSRQHHVVGLVVAAVAAHYALDHLGRARLVQEPGDLLLGQQGEVGEVLDRREQVALGIGLVAGHRRIAVEVLGLVLVLQDLALEAERQRLRAPARAALHDLVDQQLQLGLVVEVVDVQQPLGLVVVGLDGVEAERPGQALMVRVSRELVRREAQQSGAVPLGLAADIVVLVWHQLAAAAVPPRLAVLELAGLEHLAGVEGAAVARQGSALLEQQHAAPGPGQLVGGGRAAGAGACDDHVVAI